MQFGLRVLAIGSMIAAAATAAELARGALAASYGTPAADKGPPFVVGTSPGTLRLGISTPQESTQDTEWRTYGGDLGARRYSPLDQINANNVQNLEVAWRWMARNFGPAPEFKNETTPLMIDGVLYATAGTTRSVVAIDAATGETLWIWRMDEGERYEKAPRKFSGRGVAYWSDGQADERIYVATPGFHLVALNRHTGQPVTSFGEGGFVDMMEGVRGPDPVGKIGSTSPPLIVGDVLIVGPSHAVGLRPKSRENVKGDVRAYDAHTGERLWTFHTIPEPGEYGHETWEGDSWKYTGNTGVWAAMSADPELGTVYLPVEEPTSDFYGGHRHGDNLFANSLVCLDARTGERLWHFQLIHHDIWDYDNPTAPILVDVVVDGRPIETVVQLTKQAWAYVFDRVTGEPVWPIEERPVPASDVPGERASPTQPFVTRPAAFDRQGITADDLIDFTPELRARALQMVSEYRLGSLFSPPSLVDASDGTKGTLSLPNLEGGANWEAGAVDPETGILYVGSQTIVSRRALTHDPEASDVDYVLGGYSAPRVSGLPLVKPPWGRITAIDLNTGEHLWMVPNGDTPEEVQNHPALRGLDLPRTGKATRAGILVTKTLLFAGEGYGGGPVFRAHDKMTGEIIAEIELPASQVGLPMTYMLEGRQYIVMSVGGPGHPAELVALMLPVEEREREEE